MAASLPVVETRERLSRKPRLLLKTESQPLLAALFEGCFRGRPLATMSRSIIDSRSNGSSISNRIVVLLAACRLHHRNLAWRILEDHVSDFASERDERLVRQFWNALPKWVGGIEHISEPAHIETELRDPEMLVAVRRARCRLPRRPARERSKAPGTESNRATRARAATSPFSCGSTRSFMAASEDQCSSNSSLGREHNSIGDSSISFAEIGDHLVEAREKERADSRSRPAFCNGCGRHHRRQRIEQEARIDFE